MIEAVGTQESMMQAIRSTRPGGHVGFVGVTHGVEMPGLELFFAEVHLLGGPAPVRRHPLFDAQGPARASGAWVTFEPGARTAWHTHPAGQRLVVTADLGWVQQWGGRTQEIRPDDVVWIPPGLKHWHGATPTAAMTHIAIQEAVEGKVVDWMEHVTDEQYVG